MPPLAWGGGVGGNVAWRHILRLQCQNPKARLENRLLFDPSRDMDDDPPSPYPQSYGLCNRNLEYFQTVGQMTLAQLNISTNLQYLLNLRHLGSRIHGYHLPGTTTNATAGSFFQKCRKRRLPARY